MQTVTGYFKDAAGKASFIRKMFEKGLELKATFGADGFTIGAFHLDASEITDMAFHGRRKIVFSSGKGYYELVPDDGVNVIKFVWLYREQKQLKSLEASGVQ